MTREEFEQRLKKLQETILRALASYEVTKKLRYHDQADADWTLEDQNDLLGRYRGFFTPISLAMTDTTFMQFAKIFDPDKRTASFKILLDAATQDPSLLPHISTDELAEVREDVDGSKILIGTLKQMRDQQLAHTDANPDPISQISLGALDTLAESVKTNINRISSGFDRSVMGWSFPLETSSRDSTAVLRALIEHEERRKLQLENGMVQIGVDHLRSTEARFGERLDQKTIRQAIRGLSLSDDQIRRVEEEYADLGLEEQHHE